MNSLAEFIGWDVRNWSAALQFWSAHTKQHIANCSALELGSRNGGLSLWLALQGVHVICSDIGFPGVEMVRRHQEHGVSHLIQYECIDATNIPYTNEFEIVVFKSLLGALKDAPKATSEMHKALKKGGELFFAENLTASPLHQYFRRKFVPWGSGWNYVSVPAIDRMLSQFSHVQYHTVGFTAAFGRGEKQRDFLGVLDQTVFNHIVPDNWKYIIIGMATK